MKIWRRLVKEEKGATIVIVALSLTVLIAMVGTVTDVGLVYSNKWKAANAVDASALAGAQELPTNVDVAKSKALQYALKNGLDNTYTTSITVSADKTELTVEAQKSVNLLFAKILGFSKSNVKVSATAKVGSLKSMVGAAPLGIEDQTFIYGEKYVLKTSDSTYGWFGPLTLGGSGASTYKLNLEYGYNKELKVGDSVPTETGNVSGPTEQAIEYRLDNCKRTPPCTFDNFERGCPQILLIPVIEPDSGSGNQVKSVKIVGFASFFVDTVSGSGKESIITGYFVNEVNTGDIDFTLKDYGLHAVKLIK